MKRVGAMPDPTGDEEFEELASNSYRVAVVGAGISGLYMSERLMRAGIDFTVYESAAEVGGTWRDNTYPGLFVDVLSRQYEFPFRPNYDWSRKFAPQPEIQDYLLKVTRERGWRKYILFNTTIVEARFANGRWHLTKGDGSIDIVDAVVMATGFLRQIKLPEIEGRDSFKGAAFHSARWDHGVVLTGKRVGIVGNGASGIQIAETLAVEGVDVTHFVRSPQWIQVRENPASTWWGRLGLRLPLAYRLRTRYLWKWLGNVDRWRIYPDAAPRDVMARELVRPLEAMRDESLREKLRPKVPVGCMRIPKSDKNYYAAMELPNAALETREITCVREDGVVLDDGSVTPLDVLVYATGFESHAYMRPMKVIGKSGVTIDEAWKDGVYSYLGMLLPDFPNMFMLYGPFSPVNNVPIPLGLEHETSYIMQLLALARRKRVVIAPSKEATTQFVSEVQAKLPDTVFVGCGNWYRGDGGLEILWPFSQQSHRDRLAKLTLDDLILTPVAAFS